MMGSIKLYTMNWLLLHFRKGLIVERFTFNSALSIDQIVPGALIRERNGNVGLILSRIAQQTGVPNRDPITFVNVLWQTDNVPLGVEA